MRRLIKALLPAPKRQPAPLPSSRAAVPGPLARLTAALRKAADDLEAGTIQGIAVVTTSGDSVDTHVCDPGPTQRMRLIGGLSQLTHIVNTTETNGRMASLSRQLDPLNHGA